MKAQSKLSLLIWTKGTAYQHRDWSGYVNTTLLQWNVECFAIFTNFGKINLEQSWLIQPRVLFASWLLNTMRQHLIVAKSKAQSDDKCFTVFKIEENFIWQQIFSANSSTTSHSFETEKGLPSFSRQCLVFQSNQLWFFLFDCQMYSLCPIHLEKSDQFWQQWKLGRIVSEDFSKSNISKIICTCVDHVTGWHSHSPFYRIHVSFYYGCWGVLIAP